MSNRHIKAIDTLLAENVELKRILALAKSVIDSANEAMDAMEDTDDDGFILDYTAIDWFNSEWMKWDSVWQDYKRKDTPNANH